MHHDSVAFMWDDAQTFQSVPYMRGSGQQAAHHRLLSEGKNGEGNLSPRWLLSSTNHETGVREVR